MLWNEIEKDGLPTEPGWYIVLRGVFGEHDYTVEFEQAHVEFKPETLQPWEDHNEDYDVKFYSHWIGPIPAWPDLTYYRTLKEDECTSSQLPVKGNNAESVIVKT